MVVRHQFLAWLVVAGNTTRYREIMLDVFDRFDRGDVPDLNGFLACAVVQLNVGAVDPCNMEDCLRKFEIAAGSPKKNP